LNSLPGLEAIDSICVELTRKRFSLADLQSLRFSLPPRSEQDAIAQWLKGATGAFDALVTEARRAIELLQERRTALISAAVTGKIDVRGMVDNEAA
jgi:type I restriction enzyme S subunit